jgi:ATP-dependent RNA helicase RhlE
MSFEPLGLTPELLRAVADQGYVEPTAVQAEAIPLVLEGRDVLAGAQTGTGKTAAFVLPILQRLHATRPTTGPAEAPARGSGSRSDHHRRVATRPPIRCLILTPTRELALQVEESVRTYGARRPVRSTVIYGGVGFDAQVRALRAGPEIVVATPGRLLDHVGQGTIDLSRVEILVLDEADRMLDMGFIRDIRRILALLPPRRQNLLFSATFSTEIRRLADGLLDRPAQVQVTPRNTTVELVRQVVHPVDRERKRELLSHLIRTGRIDQALVFARTKHGANRLAEQLGRDGIAAAAIHGNRSQAQRVRALADFKSGRVAILVATDIAARGIDIDRLPHVVNFELPMTPEDYVHRIGRTARAGLDGDAVSLVCVDESKLLWQIEALLRMKLPVEVVAGFEPDRSIRPEPIRLRQAAARPRPAIGQPHRPGRPGAGFAPAGRPAVRPGRPARPASPRSGGHLRPDARPAQRPMQHGAPRPAAGMPTGDPTRGHGGGGRPIVTLPGERFARAAGRPTDDRNRR